MQDSTKTNNEKKSLMLMFLTLLSRCLGVVKAMATSHYFGAGALNDAISFAYNIPNNARKLFAEGAFSSAYIPTFKESASDRERTQALTSRLLTIQLLFFIPMILLTFYFGTDIITMLSAFQSDELIKISATLLPLFTIFLTFISFGALFSGILQANSLFFMVGLCPIFYSGSVILAIIFFAPQYSYLAFGYGTIVGSFLQFLSCFLACRKLGLRLSLSFDFKDKDLLIVMKRLLPIALTNIIALLSQQVTYYLASLLPEGSISAFANSIILYQTPYGIFYTAIATVYYPIFSSKEIDTLQPFKKSLIDLFTFLLPSSIALFTLSKEIISALFQHGAFTLENTLLTSNVASIYFVALTIMGFCSLLQRYNMARDNNWYMTRVIITTTVLDLGLSYIMIKAFDNVVALPIAFALSQAVGIVLFFLKIKGFEYKPFFKELLKILLCNIPLVVLCVVIKHLHLSYYAQGSTLKGLLITVALALSMVIVTLISYIVFKVPFLRALKRK